MLWTCHINSVHPPPLTFCWLGGRGGGLNLLPNSQKGGLDSTSTLRGGLQEKRVVTFFRGVAIFTKKKNKLKSEIFNNKKSLNKNIFLWGILTKNLVTLKDKMELRRKNFNILGVH